MLTTFVIGLREGLEAALIVGIVAAFLKRNGATGAVRQMWFGVGAAVAICLAGGITLALVSAHLPQREQEMLECVVAGVAVVMVSYMILWMNSHSRGLKGELESAAAGALARGSALALVAMAFLAVLREGFETSVFLLAAFSAAQVDQSKGAAAIGVLLGLSVAIGLGYLIYRGGTRINLSRFFRLTGIVLVLVAGGLVMSTLQAAHEAAWLVVGQQPMLDLSWLVRPGSVQSSLFGGILGIQPQPVVVQVAAWLLYVVPMLAVVLWPRTKRLSRPAARRLLLCVGGTVAVMAVLLALLVPAPSQTRTFDLAVAGDDGVSGTTFVEVLDANGAELTVRLAAGAASQAGRFDLPETTETTVAALVGTDVLGGVTSNRYTSGASTAPTAATGLPATKTGAAIAAGNGGRLPIGLTSADTDAELPVSYLDSWRATLWYEPTSGTVLDVQLHFVRTLQVISSAGVSVSGGVIADLTTAATPDQLQTLVGSATNALAQDRVHESWGLVVPSVLGVAAVLLLAFAIRLSRRLPVPAPRPAVRVPEPVS